MERREKQWNDERAQMVRMIAERQQPAPQPQEAQPEVDPLTGLLTEPGSWFKQQLTPYEQQMSELREQVQEMRAASEFGAETVNTSKQWIEGLFASNRAEATAIHQRIMAAPNPYAELVKEHKRQSTLSEIGDDPVAYRERLRAEIQTEMNGGNVAPQPGQPRPAPTTLPSLNRAAGNAGITTSATITEQDIFDAAPAFGKKRA
jgi:hypothetical protein